MRRWIVALILLAPAVTVAQLPECIHVEAEARYGASAYNHYVRIQNDCDRPARCQVATDVNPERTTVEVGARNTVEVITFRGSPARVFTPFVSCELR